MTKLWIVTGVMAMVLLAPAQAAEYPVSHYLASGAGNCGPQTPIQGGSVGEACENWNAIFEANVQNNCNGWKQAWIDWYGVNGQPFPSPKYYVVHKPNNGYDNGYYGNYGCDIYGNPNKTAAGQITVGAVCPAGTTKQILSTRVKCYKATCDSGDVEVNGVCLPACADGTIRDQSGQCIPQCAPGQTWSQATGKCLTCNFKGPSGGGDPILKVTKAGYVCQFNGTTNGYIPVGQLTNGTGQATLQSFVYPGQGGGYQAIPPAGISSSVCAGF